MMEYGLMGSRNPMLCHGLPEVYTNVWTIRGKSGFVLTVLGQINLNWFANGDNCNLSVLSS